MTAATEPVQKYFDTLLQNYDLLVEALEKANERGIKVSRQFASDLIAGQREAIELGKKLATEPGDLGRLSAALLEAATAAQGRALAFTQVAYQEAMAGGADTRELVQKLFEANRDTATAALEFARQWATANPMAEMFRKGFAPAQPAAQPAEKSTRAEGTAADA